MIFYISVLFLFLASAVSLIDGVYVHLVKLNLHLHPETKKEHFLHSLRAVFFCLILIFLFYYAPQGWWLYFALSLVVIDFLLEIFDIKEEGKSRGIFDGLSNHEYLLHALAISFRSLSVGLWLSSYDAKKFQVEYSVLSDLRDETLRFFIFQMIVSSAFITILHFYLILRPRPLKIPKFTCCKTNF